MTTHEPSQQRYSKLRELVDEIGFTHAHDDLPARLQWRAVEVCVRDSQWAVLTLDRCLTTRICFESRSDAVQYAQRMRRSLKLPRQEL